MKYNLAKSSTTKRAAAAALGATACFAIAAYAHDEQGTRAAPQPPGAVVEQPVTGRPAVTLPPCDRPMSVTIDLSTGTTNGVPNAAGTPDPKWKLVSAPAASGMSTPSSVYSNAHPAWAPPVPPATWVTPWQAPGFGAQAVSGLWGYEVGVLVPNGYTSIQVAGQCRADDEGKVIFNGTPSTGLPLCHFPASAPINTFSFTGTTGTNTLHVDVQNGPPGGHTSGDPTGLMVHATLTAVCRPLPPIPKGDHYLCYNTERPWVTDVVLRDQFGTFKFHTTAITRLCNPVEKRYKDGISPISNKDLHYVCYRGETHPIDRAVRINNQFGPADLKVKGPAELCLPSGKLELGGGPTGNPKD